jgi:hypothetical protein
VETKFEKILEEQNEKKTGRPFNGKVRNVKGDEKFAA